VFVIVKQQLDSALKHQIDELGWLCLYDQLDHHLWSIITDALMGPIPLSEHVRGSVGEQLRDDYA
jgi:hypothetical protein